MGRVFVRGGARGLDGAGCCYSPIFVPLSAHGGCFFVGLLLRSCRKGGVLFCLVEICFRGIGGGVFLLGLDRFRVVRWCAGDVGWGPVGFGLDVDWIRLGYGRSMGQVWNVGLIEKVVGKSREIIKKLP